MGVVPRVSDLERHALGHRDPAVFHPRDLGGVVGQKAHLGEPHAAQDLGADAEIALVVFKAEPVIGLDRVEPLILQRIGAHLVGKADAAPLLIEIKEDPRALGPHLRQSAAQLRAAIAFEASKKVAGETGRMEPRQNRCIAAGLADLDGIVLFGTVFGAEDMEPPGVGHIQRQAGRDHRMQRRQPFIKRGLRGQDRQIVVAGKGFGVAQRRDQHGGQEPRGLGERDAGAMQIGSTLAFRPQGAFHGRAQVVRWIGNPAHPRQCGIGRHKNPRQIAVIGTRLERFGAVVGDGDDRVRSKGPQLGQTSGVDRFGGQHEASLAQWPDQHHRHTHPNIGPRPRELFVDVRCKGHEIRHPFPAQIAVSASD